MAAALRRLRALGRRRRRPLSLTERSGLTPAPPTLADPRQLVASRSAAAVGLLQLAPRRCRLTPSADWGSGGDPDPCHLSADWSGLGLAKIAERRRGGGGGCHRWSEQADLAGANVARPLQSCNRRGKVTFPGSNVNRNGPGSWEYSFPQAGGGRVLAISLLAATEPGDHLRERSGWASRVCLHSSTSSSKASHLQIQQWQVGSFSHHIQPTLTLFRILVIIPSHSAEDREEKKSPK
ncbi:uncharacterized protein LOC117802456 [Ailuropoda melanoleuca]|uniref:uncharacterized protein LOC117802456 n=1 Tax=Ailuropoda melanoleuca TaxID=9646 RepID=UPI001494DC49|nr:uncharacterized protein LOC117802456 [Ailuropoda melanoleuca]